MVERDPFERRGFAATVPDDAADPAQFGQILETVKDAVVLEVRHFFNQPQLNTAEPERRREIPTVRKYAVGFGPGTDPYETVQKIVSDWHDANERLPHAAVTAVSGTNNRLTAGQPFIGHVQLPPRVRTTNSAPFAFGASLAEIWRVTVTAAIVGARLAVTLNGQDFEYTVQVGDTTQTAARGLRDALRNAEPLFTFALLGSAITITAAELNVAFTPAVTAGLSAVQVQAAGSAESDQIVFRTTPDHRNAEIETVELRPRRFPTAAPVTAATAADTARVFNEQALFAHAEVDGNQVRLYSGGRSGGKKTPNEIEILSETTSNALTVLGLGAKGTGGAPDTVAGSPPDTPMTLTTTGVGTAATAAVSAGVSAYVTLAGLSEGNNGRFKVLSVVGPNAVTYENADGFAESFNGATWFVGFRDDWRNTARPVMNRRHTSFKLNVSISVLAESPNERDELHDLLLAQFAYYLEIKYFELLGRGFIDPDNFPNELWQVSIGQDIAPGGQQTVNRQADLKGPIHEARITVPMTLIWYQDRSVLVPSGPKAGTSFVVTGDDVTGVAEALPPE